MAESNSTDDALTPYSTSSITTDETRVKLAQYALAQIGDLLTNILDEQSSLDTPEVVGLLCRCDSLTKAAALALDTRSANMRDGETETLERIVHRGGI